MTRPSSSGGVQTAWPCPYHRGLGVDRLSRRSVYGPEQRSRHHHDAVLSTIGIRSGRHDHHVQQIGSELLFEPQQVSHILVPDVVRTSPPHTQRFPHPLNVAQAAGAIERQLESLPAVTIEPTRQHLSLMRGLLERAGTAGNLVGEVHLAALALEHCATVVSFDRDFARSLRAWRCIALADQLATCSKSETAEITE